MKIYNRYVMNDQARANYEIEPIPPATPLPSPSKAPRLTLMTGLVPGLWSVIRHPFKPEKDWAEMD